MPFEFYKSGESPPVFLPPPEGYARRTGMILVKGAKLMKRLEVKAAHAGFVAVLPPTEADIKAWQQDDISGTELSELDYPKVPWDDADGGLVQAWNYFATVYKDQQSEAFCVWHWDAKENKYFIVVPAYYQASSGGVDRPAIEKFCRKCRVGLFVGTDVCPHCEGGGEIDKIHLMGTSHSHGSMSAFHSGTDDKYEEGVTGFHVTFGSLATGPAGIAPSFCVGSAKIRFKTEWHHHFKFDATDESEKRWALWRTLVGRSSSGSGYVVKAEEKVVFAFETRQVCEKFVEVSKRSDLTIEDAPKIETKTSKEIQDIVTASRLRLMQKDRLDDSDLRDFLKKKKWEKKKDRSEKNGNGDKPTDGYLVKKEPVKMPGLSEFNFLLSDKMPGSRTFLAACWAFNEVMDWFAECFGDHDPIVETFELNVGGVSEGCVKHFERTFSVKIKDKTEPWTDCMGGVISDIYTSTVKGDLKLVEPAVKGMVHNILRMLRISGYDPESLDAVYTAVCDGLEEGAVENARVDSALNEQAWYGGAYD